MPSSNGLHWAPNIWLLYLPALFVAPVMDHAGTAVWMATIGALLVFVPLYLCAHALRGRETVIGVIALIAALGCALVPINATASIFWIYAASFTGLLRPSRRAFVGLLLLLSGIAIEAALVKLSPAIWCGAGLFAALVGASNAHFATVQTIEEELARIREDVASLATGRERERIARDVHDVLGHTLSLIAIKAAVAERVLYCATDSAFLEVQQIGDIARMALQDVRSIVHGWRDGSLARELAAAQVILDAAHVCPRIVEWEADVSAGEEAVLALILREAVTNVARHSRATNCTIALRTSGLERVLEVADDGTAGLPATPGDGIAGMQTRAMELGGTLTAGPKAGGSGWTVVVCLAP